MNWAMNYGKAIRICRSAYGLTQGELAKRLRIGASQLSLIESGKRQPSLGVLNDISAALGVPPHLLTLLASEPGEMDKRGNEEELAELAKALLRLLVTAREEQLPLLLNRPQEGV
jgi:XRE family transcriptional regulator, fatty acid utilization regulator